MTDTELKTAIIILQGCIAVRRSKIIAIKHNGLALEDIPKLEAEIDDLQLAIDHVKGVIA